MVLDFRHKRKAGPLHRKIQIVLVQMRDDGILRVNQTDLVLIVNLKLQVRCRTVREGKVCTFL